MSYLNQINTLITGTDKQSERLKNIVEGMYLTDNKSIIAGIKEVLIPFKIEEFNEMALDFKKMIIDSWQA